MYEVVVTTQSVGRETREDKKQGKQVGKKVEVGDSSVKD